MPSETALAGYLAHGFAGLVLGAAYRAASARTEDWARAVRYPEIVVIGGLSGRLTGLGAIGALISNGADPAAAALVGGFALAWLAPGIDRPDRGVFQGRV